MQNQLLFWQLQPSVLRRKSEKWCQDPGDEIFKTDHLQYLQYLISLMGAFKNINHNVWNKGTVLNTQMSLKCTIWKTESPSWSVKTWALGGKPALQSWKIQSVFISDASIPQPGAHPQSDTTQSDNTCSVDFNKLGAQICSVTLGKPQEFKEQTQIRFPLRILWLTPLNKTYF